MSNVKFKGRHKAAGEFFHSRRVTDEHDVYYWVNLYNEASTNPITMREFTLFLLTNKLPDNPYFLVILSMVSGCSSDFLQDMQNNYEQWLEDNKEK